MYRVLAMCIFTILFLTGFTTVEEPLNQEEEELLVKEDEDENQKEKDSATVEELSVDEEAVLIESQFEDKEFLQIIKEKIKSNGHDQLSYDALEEIKELDNIRELKIESIQGIELLTELVKLEMRDNKITDLTPLSQLNKLEEIDLRNNTIKSLKGIESLSNLKELDFRGNGIHSVEEVKNLNSLVELDFRDNKLEDLTSLESLSNLKELNVRNNNISDVSPLANLVELEVLNLHTNKISDIASLKNLTKITELTLRRNLVSDISVLQNLTLLEDLNIRDNKITDISPLGDLQSLTIRLHLRDNPIKDYSPIAHYYDQIADIDFVITDEPAIDLEDLNTLDSEERIAKLRQYIIDSNQHIKENSIKEEKLKQLAANPFAFYRGTASLFFLDVKDQVIKMPEDWKELNKYNTWITGDLHIENLGFYGNRNGEASFDLNDFDEAAIAPFHFDLLNYGTSLYLLNDVAPNLQLDAEEINNIVKQYGAYYREAIGNVADGKVNIQEHYFTKNNLDGFIGKFASEVSQEPLHNQLTTWTIVEKERLFNLANNRLEGITEEERKELTENWDSYIDKIDTEIRQKVGKDYFKIKDISRRVDAGLGSLGYDRYYVLIEGKTESIEDDIILDVKAQGPSAVESSGLFTSDAYSTHASRTISGVFALLNYPDIHWGTLETEQESYLVKERSPYKDEVGPTDIKGIEDLDNYIKASAEATAYAHSRAARQIGSDTFATQLSAVFHELEDFDERFAEMTLKYYAQVNKDHELYSGLYKEEAFAEADQDENTDKENDTNEDIAGDITEDENIDSSQEDDKNSNTDEENPKDDSDDNQTNLEDDKNQTVDNQWEEETSPLEDDKKEDKGELLPNTATSMFNYLTLGIILLLIGSIMFWLYKKKKVAN